MTFPDTERVVSGLEHWATRIMIFSAVGTCLCFAGFAYLQVKTGRLASAGQKARTRQQAVFPISVKAYTWIAKHPDAHITTADLDCFRTGVGCPATPTRTP